MIILRSLARQFSCLKPDSAILGPAKELYETRKASAFANDELTIDQSTVLIIELNLHRSLCTIVIDALDDCDCLELLDILSRLLKERNGLVKILLSSREDRDIVCRLDGCLNLSIEARNNQADIVQFINTEVGIPIQGKKLLYGKVPDALRHDIQHVLCDRAQGMWVIATACLAFPYPRRDLDKGVQLKTLFRGYPQARCQNKW